MLNDDANPATRPARRPGVAALALAALLGALLVGFPMPARASLVSVADAAAVIEGSPLVFEVTRDTDGGTEVFDWSVSGGTAQAADVGASSGTLTLQPGDASGSFEVTTLDDDIDENPAETVTVSVTSRKGGAAMTASGSIQDNDAITLTIGNDTVVEGGTASLVITMSNPSQRTAAPTVEVATTAGTATSSDFTPINQTITLPNNGVTTTATVNIATADDSIDEPDQSFTAKLSNATQASIGTPDTGTVTITDNDIVTLTISSATVSEGDDATLTITMSNATERDPAPTVKVTTTPGTATTADYTPINQAITLPNNGITKTTTVSIATSSDGVDEPDESFTATLSDPTSGAQLGSPKAGTVTITDDDVITLTIGNDTVVEGGTATVVITMSKPTVRSPAPTVKVTTTPGTATTADFTPITQTVTLPNDGVATTATVNIATADDSIDEPDQSFTAKLSSATQASIGTPDTGTVTITDNDVVTLSIDDTVVTEGDDATLTITMSSPSEHSPAPTVKIATAAGTASVDDFTPIDPARTITLPNDGAATTAQVVIATTQDLLDEASERFTAVLSGATTATVSADDTGTVDINDDDPTAEVVVVKTEVNASEGGVAVIELRLSDPNGRTSSVRWRTIAGTATATADYTPTADGVVTLPSDGSVVTVSVDIATDSVDENDETFTVEVFSPTGAELGAVTRATVTITDTNQPSVSLSGAATVGESDGTYTLTLDVTPVPANDVTVTLELAPPAEADADDFAIDLTPVVIEAGLISETVTVSITPDEIDEIDERFTVRIASASGATIGASTVTTTILDDDEPPIITIADRDATEGESLTFTLTKTGLTDRTVTVDYATLDGTATGGEDYVITSGTATFAPDVTSFDVVIMLENDTIVEPAEEFTLELSGATLATLARTSAVATINDDGADAPVPSLARTPAGDVDEGTTVTLDASGSTGDGVLTFLWTFPDGSTAEGATASFVAADQGDLLVSLQVTDEDGDRDSVDATITALNVAPNLSVTGDEGGIVSTGPRSNRAFTATVSDPGTDTVTVTWDFGDGSDLLVDSTTDQGAEQTFAHNHSWTTLGLFDVTVTADDGEGGTEQISFQVNVRDEGSVTRSSGDDRIATSTTVALDHFGTASTVILARSDDFPDALSAAGLARAFAAPVLLTRRTSLDPRVATTIESLGANRVILLGGESALGPEVFAAVDALDGVTVIERIAGTDRFDTAAKVALRVGAPVGKEAVVALGFGADGRDAWPDALAAGAFRGQVPILLTRPDRLPQATIDVLETLGIERIFLVGGTAAVSAAVETELRDGLGLTVERLAGEDRYGTSTAVAARAISRFGADPDIVLATGAGFPDGLTAGALAAHLNGVVVLVHPRDLNETLVVRAFLQANSPDLIRGYVVGGTTAVNRTVLEQVERDIDG